MSSESSSPQQSDDAYVHRPDGSPPDDAESAVERRGWTLVAVVVLSVLVVPAVIYLRPATPAEFGLPFVASMLVLPMLPAVLLGFVAVWSMKGPKDE